MSLSNNFWRHATLCGCAAVGLMSLASCSKRPQDVLTVEQQVHDYYVSTSPAAKNNFEEGYSAYFDFSDGMPDAYQSEQTKEILEALTQKVTGYGWHVYGLGDWKIDDYEGVSQTELYRKIIQSKYESKRAPIEKALVSIVEGKKLSLLVTDFEEYGEDFNLRYQAFATPYFIDWLNLGGQITFYVTDYYEKQQPKHLYYIVFDNKAGEMNTHVQDALKGRPVNYRIFTLTNQPIVAETHYPSTTKGGNYHSEEGIDIISAVNETDDDPENGRYINYTDIPSEFLPCGDTWAHIQQNAESLKEYPEVDFRYYALLRSLTFDNTCKDSYDIKSFSMRVTNVQNDFYTYTMNQAALRNQPDTVTADDGTKVFDCTTHPDAQFYYDMATGEIFSDYVYYKSLPTPEVKDMLDFRYEVMEHTALTTPGLKEVAIEFSKNFHGTNKNVNPGDLLRIDILIDQVEIDYARIDSLFQWGPDNHGVINRNLKEAIRNTLDEHNPKGQVVYTYFIKAY